MIGEDAGRARPLERDQRLEDQRVAVGRTGIRRADPGYMQALVANSVLGGGYSSRLKAMRFRLKRTRLKLPKGRYLVTARAKDPARNVGPGKKRNVRVR